MMAIAPVYPSSARHEEFFASAMLRRVDDDDLPDARDGLTRKERVVLWVLAKLEEEEGGRSIPLPMLYGRVVEHVDMSIHELQEIVASLGARRL